MHIDAIECATLSASDPAVMPVMIDPLGHDAADDEVVVTTTRSLIRLVLVAADTASRFEREAVGHDPVAWMLAPRALFDGRTAIEACLGRDECLRAVLLHGLSLDLDADPEELDALTDDDDHDPSDDEETADEDAGDAGQDSRPGEVRPRLWTSFHVENRTDGMVQAFDAIVAGDRLEVESRLRARHGFAAAKRIEIVEGFDPNAPMAEALVSPAVADMLEQAAAAPESPLAKGLSVYIEQRFAA